MTRETGSTAESFRLPVAPGAAGMARERVSAMCGELDEKRLYVAELLTSELVTNAVRHPRRSGPSPWASVVEITIQRTGQVLRVEVKDPDPRLLAPVRRPDGPQESGWGLYLLSELSTKWGCRPIGRGDGKVVWFEMSTGP